MLTYDISNASSVVALASQSNVPCGTDRSKRASPSRVRRAPTSLALSSPSSASPTLEINNQADYPTGPFQKKTLFGQFATARRLTCWILVALLLPCCLWTKPGSRLLRKPRSCRPAMRVRHYRGGRITSISGTRIALLMMRDRVVMYTSAGF